VSAGAPSLTWDLVADWERLTAYPFMVQALEAGTIVAVMAGAVGWFMVLRRQTFAGHTLAVISFPGAAAATLAALPIAVGYFGACGLGALALGAFGRGGRAGRAGESAAIGTLQAFALGLGFLFVSLYGGVLGDLESLLFGDLLGIDDGQVLLLAVVALVALALLAALARPLLFASVDADVAAARGVPVRGLSLMFLLLLGLAVAATSQITGVLLVFALLVAPAASAQALTVRPLQSLLLTVALGLAIVWLGLAISYFSAYPAGFFIATVAFAVYVLARLSAAARARLRAPEPRPPAQEPCPEGVIA
jgi:zinc/manganese transport system permease protein